jgi:hypothetical protein
VTSDSAALAICSSAGYATSTRCLVCDENPQEREQGNAAFPEAAVRRHEIALLEPMMQNAKKQAPNVLLLVPEFGASNFESWG